MQCDVGIGLVQGGIFVGDQHDHIQGSAAHVQDQQPPGLSAGFFGIEIICNGCQDGLRDQPDLSAAGGLLQDGLHFALFVFFFAVTDSDDFTASGANMHDV